MTLTRYYPPALRSALAHPDVRTESSHVVPTHPCECCQLHGRRAALEITWLPRASVLSVGSVEACLHCAADQLDTAIGEALDGSLVRVELYQGRTSGWSRVPVAVLSALVLLTTGALYLTEVAT